MDKRMVKKGIIVILFVLVFLPFSSAVRAFTLPDIDKDIKVPFLPTATPTQKIQFIIPTKFLKIPTGFFTATNTPVPVAPTFTPAPAIATPTVVPILTKAETPVTETQEPTVASTSGLTPMPTTTPGKIGAKEVVFLGAIGFLILIIIIQGSWPKIKNWLHNNTE